MATETHLVNRTKKCGANLTGKQYHAVKIDPTGDGSTVILCGAGEMMYGILQNEGNTGDAVTVAVGGLSKAVAGATTGVTAGGAVKVDAAGQFVDATKATVNTSDAGAASDPVVGSNVVGMAEEAVASGASAQGTVFSLWIERMGAVPTTAA